MNLLDSGNKLLDDMFMDIYYEIIKSKNNFDIIKFKKEFLQFHEIMSDYIDIAPDLGLIKKAIEKYGIDEEFVEFRYKENLLFLEVYIQDKNVDYIFDILIQLIEMLPFYIEMWYYRPDKNDVEIITNEQEALTYAEYLLKRSIKSEQDLKITQNKETDLYPLLKNGFEIWDEGEKLENLAYGGISIEGKISVRFKMNDGTLGKVFQVEGDEIKIIVKVEEE